jgi:hypothetical protein
MVRDRTCEPLPTLSGEPPATLSPQAEAFHSGPQTAARELQPRACVEWSRPSSAGRREAELGWRTRTTSRPGRERQAYSVPCGASGRWQQGSRPIPLSEHRNAVSARKGCWFSRVLHGPKPPMRMRSTTQSPLHQLALQGDQSSTLWWGSWSLASRSSTAR